MSAVTDSVPEQQWPDHTITNLHIRYSLVRQKLYHAPMMQLQPFTLHVLFTLKLALQDAIELP